MVVSIHQGNCLEILDRLALSGLQVQACVTSPPYWGLRDYRAEGQIGDESTVEEFVVALGEVFDKVAEVLRPDGTLWLNLGDKHIDKDLMLVPARVAMELQRRGWILRQEMIWYKTNGLPENVSDRPTTSHEHIFMLTRKERGYFYDRLAYRRPDAKKGKGWKWLDRKAAGSPTRKGRSGAAEIVAYGNFAAGAAGPNLKSVMPIATASDSNGHSAVFPEDLIEPFVRLSGGISGCCSKCGTAYSSVLEETSSDGLFNLPTEQLVGQPRCDCQAEIVPAVVLDPFLGSGTTAAVADRNGCDSVGIEINRHYAETTAMRLRQRGISLMELVS